MVIFHFGYLDPGSGSMLLQVIFGGVLGGAYVGRKAIQRVFSSFKGLFTNQSATSDLKDTKVEANDKR